MPVSHREEVGNPEKCPLAVVKLTTLPEGSLTSGELKQSEKEHQKDYSSRSWGVSAVLLKRVNE